MPNPRDAKLSEIRHLQHYREQLSIMLPYLDPKLRKDLQAEVMTVEEQINTLSSAIRSRGRNRRRSFLKKG